MTKQVKSKMAKKKTLGVFSLTSCSGCQMEILNFNKELIDLMEHFQIIHFPMIKEFNEDKPCDIALVEGCVTTRKQVEKLKSIRKKTGFLIALGTCATFGGIPSIKDFMSEESVEKEVYNSSKNVSSVRAVGIAQYVDVDYFLHGCPHNKGDFLRLFQGLSIDKVPKQIETPVCVECRKRHNACLLQKGEPCMGAVTHGGCDAECPSVGIICHGCRGPIEDANVAAEVKLFSKFGYTQDDIERFFSTFAGTSKVFNSYCHEHKSSASKCRHLHKRSRKQDKVGNIRRGF